MTTAPADVEKTITEFLNRVDKMPPSLTADLALYADGIGLDSLETAELSAILEDEHGTDPFNDGEMPETVGDILAFYAASA
ncbi:MAG: hypothetical protein JWP74_3217 [Marmoricola sp.]|nr:hypothetical protein [Marmoricola sp.]